MFKNEDILILLKGQNDQNKYALSKKRKNNIRSIYDIIHSMDLNMLNY